MVSKISNPVIIISSGSSDGDGGGTSSDGADGGADGADNGVHPIIKITHSREGISFFNIIIPSLY